MDDKKDLCPISDNGNHRYFIFKAVEVFVPYTGSYDSLPVNAGNPAGPKIGDLYVKKEMVVSGCNCGASISQVVPIR